MLRFGIFVSCFAPADPAVLAKIQNLPIAVPTLHVLGDADPFVVAERSRELAAMFVDPVIVTHPGGHIMIPKELTDTVKQFLAELPPRQEPDLGAAAAGEKMVWCPHPDCLFANETFADAEALKRHTTKQHKKPKPPKKTQPLPTSPEEPLGAWANRQLRVEKTQAGTKSIVSQYLFPFS